MDEKRENLYQLELAKLKKSPFEYDLYGIAAICALIYYWLQPWRHFENIDAEERVGLDPVAFTELTLLFASSSAIWLIFWAINFLLLLTPLRATMGMICKGVKLEKRPSRDQAFKVIFLTPDLLAGHPFAIYFLARSLQGPISFYEAHNQSLLAVGLFISVKTISFLRHGRTTNDLWRLTGLQLVATEAKQTKIKKKIAKKKNKRIRQALRYNNWERLGSKFLGRPVNVVYGLGALYISVLIVTDFAIKPTGEDIIYAPYEVSWGKDNGYFALRGLEAPPNDDDFAETGRAITYQEYKNYEQWFTYSSQPYRFNGPPAEEFSEKSDGFQKLGLIYPEETGIDDALRFSCVYNFETDNGDTPCPTYSDLQRIIAANDILWQRFNSLPDHTNFQRPPEGINEFSGSLVINLATLKAGEIVFLQNDGKSEKALKDWARYNGFYRHLVLMRGKAIDKAIHIIMLSENQKTLEGLLYNDPALAGSHYELIKESVLPDRNAVYHDQFMFISNVAETEHYFLPLGSSSNGIRKLLYTCVQKLEAHAATPSPEYQYGKQVSEICPEFPDLSEQGSAFFFKIFTIPGNPIMNIVSGLLYPPFLMGLRLYDQLHILDAQMRMSLLGASILKDNITAEGVATYIGAAPPEMLNPFTNEPFSWDAEGKYLYFANPEHSDIRHKFRLNL